MKKALAVLSTAAFLAVSAPAFAAEWTGKISDAMCGVKHGNERGARR